MAITDEKDEIALRHSTIDQKKDDVLSKVVEIIRLEGVEKVLVGVPLGLSGSETKQTHVSLGFIDELREVAPSGVNVEGIDEVFTSKEARRLLKAEGAGVEAEHMEAARLMLEHYLKQQG